MEEKTKDRMDSTAAQFRAAAGLPERKSNKPSDPLKPSKLVRNSEPEGGLGGRGKPEEDEATPIHDEIVEELQRGEELSAKSGQGNTTPADAATGPTVDVEGGVSGSGKKPASKKSVKK